MTYEPQLIDAVPAATAVVRARTTWKEFKGLIRPMFDRVYQAGVKLPGHNVIVYRIVDEGLEMEVGVKLDAPVELRGEIVASQTPAGRAVTVNHVGPYDRLGAAYDALRAWIEPQGLRLGNVFWEVYGHWDDDPAKLETQVFHLVAPAG